MTGKISWLACQKVMVVSGNAGRNFSPPRPPCPVTITLTHHPNCFAPCFFRRFAARLAYCCPASFWFSIPPIAFAHRSTHAFAHCFCSTLLNLAPPFRSSLWSSLVLLPFAPPFCSSLPLAPFAPGFTSHFHSSSCSSLVWISRHEQILPGGNSDGALAKTEINICASWRGRGAKSQGPGEAAF